MEGFTKSVALPNYNDSIFDRTAHSEQSFRFLDLPVELRLSVYGHLVLVGKVFYTPDAYSVATKKRFKNWKLYHAPSLQVLRVCKQVHAEAEQLYLSKNLFVLPDFCYLREPFRNPANASATGFNDRIPFQERWLFSRNALRYLKNLVISFNTRQPSPVTLGPDWTRYERIGAIAGYDAMDETARRDYAHDHACEGLLDIWVYMVEALRDNLTSDLAYLEIDVTNCYCPLGCCRMLDGCYEMLPFRRGTPKQTVFNGVRNQAEEHEILRRIESHYVDGFRIGSHADWAPDQVHANFGFKFNLEVDVWAEWKMV